MEGIKDEPHSNRSFGIKWHNMAEPAMNDWLTKGTAQFVEMKMVSKFSNTRIDVYETLCPQQMLVHKGGKIKNWGGECRDVTPTKSLSQNIRVDVNREVKFL